MNPQHFWEWSGRHRIRIRINPGIRIRIADHFWLRLEVLAEVCALWAQSSLVFFALLVEKLTHLNEYFSQYSVVSADKCWTSWTTENLKLQHDRPNRRENRKYNKSVVITCTPYVCVERQYLEFRCCLSHSSRVFPVWAATLLFPAVGHCRNHSRTLSSYSPQSTTLSLPLEKNTFCRLLIKRVGTFFYLQTKEVRVKTEAQYDG